MYLIVEIKLTLFVMVQNKTEQEINFGIIFIVRLLGRDYFK